MKKILFAFAAVLLLSSTWIATTAAAPKTYQSIPDDPFEGAFSGLVHGDRDSQAPIRIEMNQDGKDISGTLELGKGLYVDGGRCGAGYIPSTVQFAEGEAKNRQIEAEIAVKVAGIKVAIELEGELSNSGEILEAEVKVNIPWFCGPDPVVNTILFKEL